MSTTADRRLGDAGARYVRAYLEANAAFPGEGRRPLGRFLLDAHRIDPMCVWSPLPPERPDAQVERFDVGGLHPMQGPRLRDWLDEMLAPPERALVVEAVMERRGDYASGAPSANVVLAGDSVYETARDAAGALALLGGDIRWRPDIAVVTRVPASGGQLTQEDIRALAGAATAVLAGAWDDEGVVVWEP